MTSQYNGEHNNNQNEQKSFNQKHITDQVRVTTLLLIHYLVLTRLNNDSVNTKHKQTNKVGICWQFELYVKWTDITMNPETPKKLTTPQRKKCRKTDLLANIHCYEYFKRCENIDIFSNFFSGSYTAFLFMVGDFVTW